MEYPSELIGSGQIPSLYIPFKKSTASTIPSLLTVGVSPSSPTNAGLEYPQDGWTWDQFRETAEKLTKDGAY